jgi:hypothetical protein
VGPGAGLDAVSRRKNASGRCHKKIPRTHKHETSEELLWDGIFYFTVPFVA